MEEFRTVEENLRESFRILARGSERGEVRELPGVSIAAAGVAFQMFNAAFFSSPVEDENDCERRIHLIRTHFNTRGQEYACWICEGWMAPQVRRRTRALFRRHGLRLSVELPGMTAGQLLPPVRELPKLEIRRVCDESTRVAFCEIGAACFNVPPPWFSEVFGGGAQWDRFAGYVGFAGGVPVSTAGVVTAAGAAGVYNVATLPAYQRRGCGEAIMRFALEQARERTGIERTILQSTPQGYGIYERMGYRTVTRVLVYAS